MRPRRKQGGGSLDSLLDTMTNVVGILVILLVVTQLGVGDAVKRISDADSVKLEVLEEAQQQATALQAQREELESQANLLEQQDSAGIERELRTLQKKITDNQVDLEALERRRQEQMAEVEKKQEAQQKEIDQYTAKADALKQELDATEDALARLRAQLAETPDVGTLPTKIVHLPNPRPAPKESKPLVFLCREGRVIFVDSAAYQEEAQQHVERLVQRRKLDSDPEAGIDCSVILEDFNSRRRGDQDFDLKLAITGRNLDLVLNRRERAGESVEVLRRGRSRFLRQVSQIDPEQNYLQFIVWPDSFEAYLEAREIASKRNLLAGWNPSESQEEYRIRMGGPVRCGPPPKPQPMPTEPKPPKPTEPKPPARPVPSDTID
jgi:hypothetical protein